MAITRKIKNKLMNNKKMRQLINQSIQSEKKMNNWEVNLKIKIHVKIIILNVIQFNTKQFKQIQYTNRITEKLK